MLKQVPNELSPYAYPRQPGFATAVLFEEDLLVITQPSIYLEDQFVVRIHQYDAFQGSVLETAEENKFALASEAIEYWQECITMLEKDGWQLLASTQMTPVSPVGSGYEYMDIQVNQARWDPWTKEFSMVLVSPSGSCNFEKGVMEGNVHIGGLFLDHLNDFFGYGPRIQF